MTDNSIFVRVRHLLLNRTDSERFKRTFLHFTSALMVNFIDSVCVKLDAHLDLTHPNNGTPSGVAAFVTKARDAKRDALRHFGTAQRHCALLKVMQFWFNNQTSLTPKAKIVRQQLGDTAVSDDCEQRKVQEQLTEEGIRGQLGELVFVAIRGMADSTPDRFRALFICPGARKRLLRLVGTQQRVNQMAQRFNLAPIFAENALSNDNLLWSHYLGAVLGKNKIWCQAHKIGADLAVFVRWLRWRLCDAIDGKTAPRVGPTLFERIKNYISDQIYDQVFDKDITALIEMEQFLEQKLFFETKKMVENLADGEEKGTKIFQKWKKIVDEENWEKEKMAKNEGRKRDDDNDDEIGPWLRQVHRREFQRLLLVEKDDAKLLAFLALYHSIGKEKINEKLFQFLGQSIELGLIVAADHQQQQIDAQQMVARHFSHFEMGNDYFCGDGTETENSEGEEEEEMEEEGQWQEEEEEGGNNDDYLGGQSDRKGRNDRKSPIKSADQKQRNKEANKRAATATRDQTNQIAKDQTEEDAEKRMGTADQLELRPSESKLTAEGTQNDHQTTAPNRSADRTEKGASTPTEEAPRRTTDQTAKTLPEMFDQQADPTEGANPRGTMFAMGTCNNSEEGRTVQCAELTEEIFNEITVKNKKTKKKSAKNGRKKGGGKGGKKEKKDEDGGGGGEAGGEEGTTTTEEGEEAPSGARSSSSGTVLQDDEHQQQPDTVSLDNGTMGGMGTAKKSSSSNDDEGHNKDDDDDDDDGKQQQRAQQVAENDAENIASSSTTTINGSSTEETTTFGTSQDDHSPTTPNGLIRLAEFGDDQFLAGKFAQLLDTFTDQQTSSAVDGGAKLIGLIDVGILANELAHRLEAIDWLSKSDRRRKTARAKEIADQWDNEKRTKCEGDNNGTTLHMLGRMVHALLSEMGEIEKEQNGDGRGAKSEGHQLGQNWEELVGELKCRKFGMAIAGDKMTVWAQMSPKQRQMVLSTICGSIWKEEKIGGTIMEKFERNLEFLNRAEAQRKLDKNIFEQYKTNAELAQFVEKKDKGNFVKNNSQLCPSEKLQEINLSEERAKKGGEMKKIKEALQLDNENERNNGENVLIEMRKTFNEWSDEVHLQFPALYFLRHFAAQLEPICIVPEGFGQERIFGTFKCDRMTKSGDECADQSLNCAICKKMRPKYVGKYEGPNGAVPMLRIDKDNVQIVVEFVEIAQFESIPRRLNFSAHQLGVLLIKSAQIIHKMEANDHFDEGVYWHEIRSRKVERRAKYGDETTDGGDVTKTPQIAEEIRKFDQITALLHLSRENALKQRELLAKRKVALFILAEHTMHWKLVQFLLYKNDYLAIVNQTELVVDNAGGEEGTEMLLHSFRTLLAYLEEWAQNSHILAPNLGYLSTNILLIMLTKLFLLFPASSVPFLVDKFFLIYSNWKWPMPIQLAQIAGPKSLGNFLEWSPDQEWFERRMMAWENVPKEQATQKMRSDALKGIRKELAMAALWPTFPARNGADKVNISSAKVVQNELRKAFVKIKNQKEGGDGTRTMDSIRAVKFSEKYENFVLIICTGPKINVEKFCEFVGTRLRYELLEFVENPLAIWVDFCHVFPKMIISPQCSNEIEPKNSSPTKCQMFWLIGIQMVPVDQQQQKGISAFKKKLRDNLRKKMGVKLKTDFEKGWFHNVRLDTELAERQTLRNWIIDENV